MKVVVTVGTSLTWHGLCRVWCWVMKKEKTCLLRLWSLPLYLLKWSGPLSWAIPCSQQRGRRIARTMYWLLKTSTLAWIINRSWSILITSRSPMLDLVISSHRFCKTLFNYFMGICLIWGTQLRNPLLTNIVPVSILICVWQYLFYSNKFYCSKIAKIFLISLLHFYLKIKLMHSSWTE